MSLKKANIICVYNNTGLFSQMVGSIENCDIDIKIIGIDNTGNQYHSAAEAYNYAIAELIDSEVLIFCHQDIVWKNNALYTLYELCKNNKNALFGVAGVQNAGRKRETISAISDPHKRYTSLQINQVKDIFTLDECVIASNRAIFSKVHFDSDVCSGWDFYAVDLCLQCHKQNIRVAVVGVDILHLSGGKLSDNFYLTEKGVANKYRFDHLKITSTCDWCYTWGVLRFLYKCAKKVRDKIFKNRKIY